MLPAPENNAAAAGYKGTVKKKLLKGRKSTVQSCFEPH